MFAHAWQAVHIQKAENFIYIGLQIHFKNFITLNIS